MAFKKIKLKKDPQTARRHDRFEVISLQDDAVDTEKSDFVAYQRTLDPGFVVLKEGEEPSVFVIQSLLQDEFSECYVAGGAAADRFAARSGGNADIRTQSLTAYEFGLVRIKGLQDGETLDLKPLILAEIGGYIVGLTTGRFDTDWQNDLGKFSWLVSQAQRSALLKSQASKDDSTATPAKDASSSSEDVASTLGDSGSPSATSSES